MKFKDLKTGMFIKAKDNDYAVIVDDTVIFENGMYCPIEHSDKNTNLNMTFITAVYPSKNNDGLINCFNTLHSGDAKPIWEYQEPILTLVEKQYLKDVIRPFKGRIDSINKLTPSSGSCYIRIKLDDGDMALLPNFDIGDYYLGMEPNTEYDLEELGLNNE